MIELAIVGAFAFGVLVGVAVAYLAREGEDPCWCPECAQPAGVRVLRPYDWEEDGE